MPGIVRWQVLLAGLAAITSAALYGGPRLPEPLHVTDGSLIIIFGLGVYVGCLIMIVITLSPRVDVQALLNSRHRMPFSISAAIILLYSIWVSTMLYGLSQSTDL